MKKPTMMRLDPELIGEIEAYRVKTGIKTTSEATRRLIVAGLEVAPVRGEPLPPDLQAARDADEAFLRGREWSTEQVTAMKSKPAKPLKINRLAESSAVPFAGDLPRRGAMPKKR